MTREHLIDDIQNVLQMAGARSDPAQAERIRRAFAGLHRHIGAESDVPQRVESCLAESLRVLERAGESVDEDTWDYARTCLEAALDFARESRPASD